MLDDNQCFSISIIRSVSVLLIISCHILQGYNNFMAFWLNIGVQIFLVLSGFLFGAKDISNYIDWYVKRFKRIFKPYYIYLIIIIPIFIKFDIKDISLIKITYYFLNLQGIGQSISGLGHLWYITLITICYLITPIMFKYNISRKANSELIFYSLMFIQFAILQLILSAVGNDFAPWIATYMVGFYIAGRYNYKTPKKIKYLLSSIVMVLLPVKIYFQYFYDNNQVTAITKIIYLGFPWFNALLGCTIFIILFDLLSKYGSLKNKKIFAKITYTIDKYSYETYITHHVYILGTFSMLNITGYSVLNILSISLLIILSSFILKKLSQLEIKSIQLYYKKLPYNNNSGI